MLRGGVVLGVLGLGTSTLAALPPVVAPKPTTPPTPVAQVSVARMSVAGCEACRMTGFKGRTALYEVLSIDNRLGGLIAEEASLERLWQETFGRNGGSLWDAARDKVRQGLTTVEEAIRVLFDYRPPGSEAPAKPEAPTTQAP